MSIPGYKTLGITQIVHTLQSYSTRKQAANKKRTLPIASLASMYGIFAYIYHKNQPNEGKYTSPMDGMGYKGGRGWSTGRLGIHSLKGGGCDLTNARGPPPCPAAHCCSSVLDAIFCGACGRKLRRKKCLKRSKHGILFQRPTAKYSSVQSSNFQPKCIGEQTPGKCAEVLERSEVCE